MSTAQVGCYLFNDLKHMGVILPENSQEITILVTGADDLVKIIAKGPAWDTVLRYDVFYIEDSYGDCLKGQVFYNLVKEKMQLPDDTTHFKIVIKPDEVVTTFIEAATPAGSLDLLSNFKIVSDRERPAGQSKEVTSKVDAFVEAFKQKERLLRE